MSFLIEIVRENSIDVTSLCVPVLLKYEESVFAAEQKCGESKFGTIPVPDKATLSDSLVYSKDLVKHPAKFSTLVQREIEHSESHQTTVVDPVLVNAVYFLFSLTVPRTRDIKVVEFFDYVEFYELGLDFVISLPPPSEYIPQIQPLVNLYNTFAGGTVSTVLSDYEAAAVTKLEVFIQRFAHGYSLATPIAVGGLTECITRSTVSTTTAVTAARFTNDSGATSSSAGGGSSESSRHGSSKKRCADGSFKTAAAAAPREETAVRRHCTNTSSSAHRHQLSGIQSTHSALTAFTPEPTPTPSTELSPVRASTSAIAKPFRSTPSPAAGAQLPRGLAKVVVVDTFTQHTYKPLRSAQLSSAWYNCVENELSRMSRSLPENVIVFTEIDGAAVKENSCHDLLKFLLFPESCNSPYCGGCFEFDAFLPANYPASPPRVKLITTGERGLNQRATKHGTVNLSLLGNYRGRYGSNEQWDQRRSSLIQVIWAIMEDIFTHTRPYDSAAHTTLQCAYLNHFARAQARDSSCYLSRKWIIPTLCRTWRAGGGYTAALQWAAADPALLGMTAAIEAQVRATEDEAGVAGVQTPF